jgi:hypothetical protein
LAGKSKRNSLFDFLRFGQVFSFNFQLVFLVGIVFVKFELTGEYEKTSTTPHYLAEYHLIGIVLWGIMVTF